MDPEPPSLLLAPLLIDYPQGIGIALLIVLLACSALISGVEVALFSLNTSDFKTDSSNVSKKEKIILQLLERPKKLLATILVTNNTINIAIVILFESLSTVWFENIRSPLFIAGVSLNLIFFIKVGVATFLILLFGEILPKIYASRNNYRFSMFMAYPIQLLDIVLSPISLPMRSLTLFIQQRLNTRKSNLSIDQLSHALDLTSNEDTTQEEKKILKGIVSFGFTDTKQVMKPRMDVFALQEGTPFQEVISQIVAQGYSRIPVYKDNIDTITGILFIKDLMPHIEKDDFDWVSLIREPFFVPENKKLDDLLSEFKAKRTHLAIVVDEYGGTSGIISLEDVIEEIVGDISDEYDDEDIIYSKINANTYIFEGKTPLKDFYKAIQLTDYQNFEQAKGEAETLAGFLLEIAKGFPKKGEILNFETFAFVVEQFENKRIKQIKVTLTINN